MRLDRDRVRYFIRAQHVLKFRLFFELQSVMIIKKLKIYKSAPNYLKFTHVIENEKICLSHSNFNRFYGKNLPSFEQSIHNFEIFEIVYFRRFCLIKPLVLSLKTQNLNTSFITYFSIHNLNILKIGYHNNCLQT